MPVPKMKPAGAKPPAGPASGEKETLDGIVTLPGGKPDKKAYDTEQEQLKKEIDNLQVKLSAVRDKIGLATKGNAGNDRRNELRTELDEIRGKQSNVKTSRGKLLDQIKAFQESAQKKNKDLQAAKAKVPFKTVAEVDAHIKNLEGRVESGTMKLAEEKRALQDISTARRNRRNVESFQADQEAIDTDYKTIAELRAQLDDPEFKAASDRYDEIKKEMDELKKEADEAYASRSKLFGERDEIQGRLNTLFNRKRESAQAYRDLNDRYWAKINEDRARRAERARTQRAADELQKKQDIAERILDEAKAPAYQTQIEDCQTLIDHFSGKSTATTDSSPLSPRSELAGVPKLEIRQVDGAPEGSIIRKKKNEDEDAYFVGGKGKNKGKKALSKPVETDAATPTSPNAPLNIPFATLSALLTLAIPPPASAADVPRVVEDLKTKKAWYEANQARVTAVNIARAESEVERLNQAAKDTKVETTETPTETTEAVEAEEKAPESSEPVAAES